jgi:hypothetical protein
MKRKTKIFLSASLALLATGTGFAIFAVRASLIAVDDSYAQWDAALSIISYMERNAEAWPKDWEAVHQGYLSAKDLRGLGWDNLQTRVDIDFSADPAELKKMDLVQGEPPFQVIWLRNGKQHHWSGAEPNTLILEYLKKNHTEQAGPGYPPQGVGSPDP